MIRRDIDISFEEQKIQKGSIIEKNTYFELFEISFFEIFKLISLIFSFN